MPNGGLFRKALTLARCGRVDAAIQLLAASSRERPAPDILCAIAALLVRTDRLDDAAMLMRATTEDFPEDPRGFLGLAETRLRAGNSERALKALRRAEALGADATQTDALAARIALQMGDTASAMTHAARVPERGAHGLVAAAVISEALAAMQGQPEANRFTREWLRRARDAQIPMDRGKLRVLVIHGIGTGCFRVDARVLPRLPSGNTNLRHLLDERTMDLRDYWIDAGADNEDWPEADVVVNVMAEPVLLPDALEQAAGVLRLSPNVVNAPEAILRMERSSVHARLGRAAGLYVPRCIRVGGSGRLDQYVESLAAFSRGEIAPPLLIRPAGAHSHALTLVQSIAELSPDQFSDRPSGSYLTEYVDTRLGDGMYRKSRAIVVGGRLIPEHRFIAPEFCVRAENGARRARTDVSAMDEARTYVGAPLPAPLDAIAGKLDADIYGIDYTETAGGRCVFFEASACIHFPFEEESYHEGSQLADAVGRIREAIDSLVWSRAPEARRLSLFASRRRV